MDYISREDWYELSKWLDISQGFYEAYTRFRIEGQEVHWLNFNERNIEVGFFMMMRILTGLMLSYIVLMLKWNLTNVFYLTKMRTVTKNE